MDCTSLFSSPVFAGKSSFSSDLQSLIKMAGKQTAPVLIRGEKGTGKTLAACLIHLEGGKAPEEFLGINCACQTPDQIKAIFAKLSAEQSSFVKTVFVKQIELLPQELQTEFLNILRNVKLRTGIRFICSTECNLEEKIENQSFLGDLYFQISAILINTLPLRQRKEDIMPLAEYFFSVYKKEYNQAFQGFSEGSAAVLENYFWKGNILELKLAVEKGFVTGQPPFINASDMGLASDSSAVEVTAEGEDKTLKTAVDSFKKRYVTKLLEENGWNQTKTAAVLGIQRTYVIRLINELNIRKR